MATHENGGKARGRAVMSTLSWLSMGLVFLGLAALQIVQHGFDGSLATLAINVVFGLAGLDIAFLTWRGSRR